MKLVKPLALSKEDKFCELLSNIMGIKEDKLRILKQRLGDDFYMILNILSGENIKFPSLTKLDEIENIIYIQHDINNMKNDNITYEEKIKKLSKKYKITQNKMFLLLNEYDSFF